MADFKSLWKTISLGENKISIEAYLEALNELRENYGITAINRKVYANGNKLALMRFQFKLRFMRKNGIVKEIADSSSPYNELFELLPVEEWIIMKN